MSDDALVAFERAYRGRCCSVERRESDWVFCFGENQELSVAVPWRVIQRGRIAYADSDDGQRFVLPSPIDGAAMANSLLEGRRLTALELDHVTADLHLHFHGETRLDVFNYSSVYKGWNATFRTEGDRVLIIGVGGGGISIVREAASM